jgi:SAM-dependent methyltransferase
MKPYMPVVAQIINKSKPKSILDVGAGNGWLLSQIDYSVEKIDAIDWIASERPGYGKSFIADLNNGIPAEIGVYDCIVCCEVIALLTNPGLLFSGINRHLAADGLFIISTPNTWFPQSRFQFFLRNFHSSFPNLAGKLTWGKHMHLIPWSFAQLYNFMGLHGFENIVLHDLPEKKPKHFHEWILGLPSLVYFAIRKLSAKEDKVRDFWRYAGSLQSLMGRRLVVSAVKTGDMK